MNRNLDTLNSISYFSFLSLARIISPCFNFDTAGWGTELSLQNTWQSFLTIQGQQCQRFCKDYDINLHIEEYFKAAEFNRIEMSNLPSAHYRVWSPGNDESNHMDH